MPGGSGPDLSLDPRLIYVVLNDRNDHSLQKCIHSNSDLISVVIFFHHGTFKPLSNLICFANFIQLYIMVQSLHI